MLDRISNLINRTETFRGLPLPEGADKFAQGLTEPKRTIFHAHQYMKKNASEIGRALEMSREDVAAHLAEIYNDIKQRSKANK